MAALTINSKFITFATKALFEDTDKFEVPGNSVVFISDTGEIYCKGKRYVGLVNSSEFGMVPKCNETDTLLGSTDYILTYDKSPQWKKSTNIVRTNGDLTISGTKTFTSDLYLDGDRIFTHYTDDKNKQQQREVLAFTNTYIELGKGYQEFKPLWLNGNGIFMNSGTSGKFSIGSNGHVGIGTHTPSSTYMLLVAGGSMVADKVVSYLHGFVKHGCNDNSVLLAGGGHKSLSDFKIANVPAYYSLVSLTDPYSLIKETAMSFEKDKLIHASLKCSYLDDTSFISMIGWMSSRTTDLNGWFLSNSDGNNFLLYGVHDNVWTNDTLLHSGNSYVSGGGSSGNSSITVTIGPTSATLKIPSELPADGGTADTIKLYSKGLKPNAVYAEKKLIYCLLNSTNSGKAGYAGDTSGFPVANDANGILWTGVQSGHYGGLLGISSNGYLYYRFITSKNFPTDANGESWNRIAWISEIPTKLPATKLDTAIKIYGNTFDGTTDIEEYLYGIKNICGSTDATSSLLRINGTSGYDLGKGYYNYQSWIWGKEFKFVGKKGDDNDYVFMMIGNNGNVGIGDVSGAPCEKLHVAGGNVIANGYKKYPENTYTTPYALLADGTARAITSEVTSGSSALITSGAVYSQINDIKREWLAKAGKTYRGWVTIAKWLISQAGHFSPHPFMLSIFRNYNSPKSESYTFGFTFGWDTATITQISGNNVPGDQLIEQIRVAKCSDGLTYRLDIYVNLNYSTYENTCYCVVHGYDDFTATTVCELSSNVSSTLAQTKVVANNSYALPQVNNVVTTHGYYEIKVLNNNIESTNSWCILLLHPDTTSNTANSLITGYSVNGTITLYRKSGACLSSLKILSCAGYSSSWNQALLEVDGIYAYNNFKFVTCTYLNKTYRAICFKASQNIELSQFRGFIRSNDSNFGTIITTTAATNAYTTSGNGVTNIVDYSGLQTKDILANDVRINGLSVSKVGHTHSYLPLAGGTMNANANITFNKGSAVFTTATTSNSIKSIIWYKGNAQDTSKKNPASLGWHNIGGDGTGAAYIVPYPHDEDPWEGRVGLYVSKASLKFNNYTILNSSNYRDYTVSKTGTGASGTWDIDITGNAATVSTIQTATTTTVGGIKVKSVNTNAVSTNANGTNYYGVNIDKNGVGYVALPSFGGGSGDITSIIAGTGLNGGATSGDATINLSIATTSEIGGIVVSTALTTSVTLTSADGSTTNRYYGVLIDKDAQAFVNIPWTDTKVTQTVTSSINTSWRPFLVGMSYSDAEPFAPTNATNSVYATHKLKMKPSTGDVLTYGGITLYSSSGDTPHLIFQRGTTSDSLYDWDLYVTNGIFKLRYNKNGAWNDVLSLDVNNNDYFLKDSIILTTDNSSVSGGGSSWGSSMSVTIGGATATLTIPGNPNVDTKNTAGSTNTSSKIYLIGATSLATNPKTYSHDTAYVGTDGCLYSNSQKVLTSAVTSITIIADSGIEVYDSSGNTTFNAITTSGTRRLKLCAANDTDLGGIKIGYQLNKASREYPVVLDSSYAAYVNVPLFTKSGSTACPGLVPSPSTTAGTTKYLREDGTWATPPNSNTWNANALNVAGYVAAPTSSTAEYVWKTDSNGNPSWQIDYSRGLRCKDTRDSVIATTGLSAGATFQLDFKKSAVSGLSAAYSGILSFRPYSSGSDWSGGPAHQLAFDVNGIHHRTGDGNGWGSWKKLINSSTIMGGATSSKSGTAGLVPAPPANALTKFLRGDGSWATVSSLSSTFTGDAETVGGYAIIVTDTLPNVVGASEIVFII